MLALVLALQCCADAGVAGASGGAAAAAGAGAAAGA